MKPIFENRNKAGSEREKFFNGIKEMITHFSQQDLERFRTIIFNEIHMRRTGKEKSKGKLILPSGVVGKT